MIVGCKVSNPDKPKKEMIQDRVSILNSNLNNFYYIQNKKNR